ncbi:MAG: HIT family protein [Bacteroidetes bacterium]|nr:HIT family protein [Bacteroidota bacterium]
MKLPDCIFCNLDKSSILLENEKAVVINDKYPQSKGHLLIISKDHFEKYFDLPADIRNSMWELLEEAKSLSEKEHSPAGYNINVNVGRSSGQIIMHAHIHLIPRYGK